MKRTRFPPEPNGFLHLGHVKAMMFDFKYDDCILRFDDTNPSTEKQAFVDAIREDIDWLGYKYTRVTYTSDYFEKLLAYAIELIKKDLAYVDFTGKEKLKEMRRSGVGSEYRGKSVEWNLLEFEKMAKGVYPDDHAVLRLKISMTHVNHSLRDPIAYRIKFTEHYRTKDRYKVYPTYDYSHGIVDSLEGITDSYCTMEFYTRREQYYWPCSKLGLVPATVTEFGRLNVENVILSKRKIIPLIESKVLSGFDDPRLYTIRGLRRRGFTPEILKDLVARTTMERHDSTLSKGFIDHTLRTALDPMAIRVFAVMNPIRVNIVNHTEDKPCIHGSHITKLTKQIYIERTDFRETDSADYYRLAPPKKTIRLRFSDFIEYVSHDADSISVALTIPEKPKKIKGIIHWVNSESQPAIFEIYDDLTIHRYDGFIEPYGLLNKDKIMQFERVGYFKFDRYSETKLPIFIQIISLLDKYNKKIE